MLFAVCLCPLSLLLLPLKRRQNFNFRPERVARGRTVKEVDKAGSSFELRPSTADLCGRCGPSSWPPVCNYDPL